MGSDPEIQVATNVTNHLTAATIKYFADSFRLGRAANLFEKMAEKEPEVAALLARSYIGMSKPLLFLDWTRLMFRRRDQSGPNNAFRPPTTSSILPNPTRSMRFPTIQRQTRMGPESSSTSSQLRSIRICHMGEIDGNVYRIGSI